MQEMLYRVTFAMTVGISASRLSSFGGAGRPVKIQQKRAQAGIAIERFVRYNKLVIVTHSF